MLGLLLNQLALDHLSLSLVVPSLSIACGSVWDPLRACFVFFANLRAYLEIKFIKKIKQLKALPFWFCVTFAFDVIVTTDCSSKCSLCCKN